MKTKGKQSVEFPNPPYLLGEASVVGKMEGEGPLGKYFHEVCPDPFVGKKTWEEAESALIEKACNLVLSNSGVKRADVNYIVGGDLLAQLMATSFGVENLQIPFFGIYGACSTMGESLTLSAMMVEGEYAQGVLAVTSSHFAGAEKQFRFPLPYGNQRPAAATWTVTGSGAVIVGNEELMARQKQPAAGAKVVIRGITVGRITDYGIKDSMNMGAAMAPAAASTIAANFQDFGVGAEDYDLIVTGDLGVVGTQILHDIMEAKGLPIRKKHLDCGVEIYDTSRQDVHAGGSGCGCSAVTLTGYLLRRMREGSYRRILFVPTGAMLSPVSFHEELTIPGIAYGIVLERR
ncbi:MAG: stage V sporulation protein AD [Lachnospiraceae bacterium]|nr:stage V sporulation protein AD [Lachnospiraceae bacterium]